MTRLLTLALALLGACVAPSQHDPARYGTVRVALGPSLDGVHDWRDDQARELAAALADLAALGPAWVLTAETDADVVVRAAELPGDACGTYRAGRTYVEVDAACTAGYLALRRAAGHELAHWLTWTRWRWVGHLCQWPLNADPPRGCHPTIRCDDCLLSPALAGPPGDVTTDEAYVPPVAEPAPADADLALVRTCAARGRCE